MKTRFQKLLAAFAVFVCLSTINHQLSTACAQGTVFTYQGRLTDNGTNYTGIGQLKFALVTSTNANLTATATANTPSGGFITGYTVTFFGNGYVTPPTVTIFGGGGSNAVAHANLASGMVASISVDNPGNGYTSAPTVLIAPPPPELSYTTYWSNDGTSVNGSEPASAVAVGVTNGLFTVVLGDATQPDMTAINTSLFTQPGLQLQIWFNDGVNGSSALNPVQNLTPSPYATFANTAGNLAAGLIIQQNASGAPNVIGGSSINFVPNGVVGATISGGGATNLSGHIYSNSVTADFGTVSGGSENTVSDDDATVGGGEGNTASGADATVGGGYLNNATNSYATVGGGNNNAAYGSASTVGGGLNNIANGSYATVSGGLGNTAGGGLAAVPGGYDNIASGDYSFAAGFQAQALHTGSFVWNDNSGGSFASTAANQFSIHASGGVVLAADVSLAGGAAYHNLSLSGGNSLGYLYGSYPLYGDGIHLGYNYYADASGNWHIPNTGGATSRLTLGYGFVGIYVGTNNLPPNTLRIYADNTGVTVHGTFNNLSDREAKQDFSPVRSSQILDKVAQLPVSEWSYKEDPKTRHVGPVAQDFYSVFNIGTDDKHIAPIDEGGVALAAIQGLNQKVDAGDQKSEARIQKLEAENAELKARLEKLEQRLGL